MSCSVLTSEGEAVRFLPFALIMGLCWIQSVAGQAVYNPYAKTDESWATAKSDGTIAWPPFFKSTAYEARFQSYFAMGSCCGTNPVINNSLKNNKVDVNELPETSVSGMAIKVEPGVVTITD